MWGAGWFWDGWWEDDVWIEGGVAPLETPTREHAPLTHRSALRSVATGALVGARIDDHRPPNPSLMPNEASSHIASPAKRGVKGRKSLAGRGAEPPNHINQNRSEAPNNTNQNRSGALTNPITQNLHQKLIFGWGVVAARVFRAAVRRRFLGRSCIGRRGRLRRSVRRWRIGRRRWRAFALRAGAGRG